MFINVFHRKKPSKVRTFPCFVTCLMSLCLYCLNFTLCPSVPIVNLKQVNAGWERLPKDLSQRYSEPCQTSTMELFATTNND